MVADESYQLLDTDIVLPARGAELRVERRDQESRWLVLTPRDDIGPLTLDRRAVIAFANTVELALGERENEGASLAS